MADKALVDISSEQTNVMSSDLIFIERGGVPAKITWANFFKMATGTDFRLFDGQGNQLIRGFEGAGTILNYGDTIRAQAIDGGVDITGILSADEYSGTGATLLVGGTASATSDLSGTSTAEASGLPVGLSYIEVHIKDANLSGSDNILVQLSTDETFTASGYDSVSSALSGTDVHIRTGSGFLLRRSNATSSATGRFVLRRTPGTNDWYSEVNSHVNGIAAMVIGSGFITMAGEVDGVQLLTSGTDTFDAGSVTFVTR